MPAPVFLGRGSRLKALAAMRDAGFKRLGVVLDSALEKQAVFTELLQREIPAAGLEVSVLLRSRGDKEPDYAYLDETAAAFRDKKLDAVLGIGGGSAMDLAKGIAILLTNPGKAISYRGMDLVQKPGLPVIVAPTTAGTGSEVTRTASFTDSEGRKKLGINGRFVAVWAGVLDPELTLGCPAGPTLASGLDALVHCVESFTAVTSSPLARDAARLAFPLLFNNLEKAISSPGDVDAREAMLLGAYWAGVAMWNAAGGGPASGVSYPLGVLHGVPHGYAGGLLLPGVIRHNVKAGWKGYEPLYRTIADDAPAAGRSAAFVEAMDGLYARCKAPADFGRWGVDQAAVGALVDDTMANRAANLTHNPVPYGRAEVEALLRSVAAPAGATAGKGQGAN